jgi:hypothetical protein
MDPQSGEGEGRLLMRDQYWVDTDYIFPVAL